MTLPRIYEEREAYSNRRLTELRTRLDDAPQLKDFDRFTIFTAGSYGRLEASEHSDIDLFFLYDGERGERENPNTAEIKLFGAMIEVVEEMSFPKFSNDGQYLNTRSSADILKHLGSSRDDHENLFTLRMLMLLESRCVYGDGAYQDILEAIITAYYRDYPDHQATFEPWFLMNDIGRFWKTLLLNYENKRNRAQHGVNRTKQKVRNFKLKYSRMTTCFATVAALGSFRTPIEVATVVDLIRRTPRERLELVVDQRPDLAEPVEVVLDEYAWFLQQTGLAQDKLLSLFDDEHKRSEMFAKANAFGDKMFTLLEGIDRGVDGETTRLLRFLVI